MKHKMNTYLLLLLALSTGSSLLFSMDSPKESYCNEKLGRFVIVHKPTSALYVNQLVTLRILIEADISSQEMVDSHRDDLAENPTTPLVMIPAIISIARKNPVIAEEMVRWFIPESE